VAQLAVVLVALASARCERGVAVSDASQGPDAAVACAGQTFCDGTSVRACRTGAAAEVLQDCAPEACSLGRCVSTACAVAEQDLASFAGCTFYSLDLDNVMSDDPIPSSVLVTNPGQVPATATLERRDGTTSAAPPTWTASQSAIVAPQRSVRFALADDHLEGGGLAPRGAYRVTSDVPVTAAHVQSDDSAAQPSTSSGGTMLLPAHVLGTRYRALTYAQVATPELQDTPGSRGGAGQLVVIGTVDGTHVTIAPSATANLSPGGGVPPAGPDGKIRFTLDDGDVFTLYSNRDGADLSGTEVSGDQPLSVFSGNISTTYGITATGVSSPDLAHEQLLPVSAWGTSYIAAQLVPQPGICDPLLMPPGASVWTIVADRDGTQVRFQSDAGPVAPSRTIGAGEAFHVYAVGNFAVSASAPIEIMQGMDCEPSLSSAVPTSKLLTEHTFAVLPNFATEAAIVRPLVMKPMGPMGPTGSMMPMMPMGEPVYLDGRLLDEKGEPAGGGFEIVRLPIEPCPPADGVCTHHLEGKFGLTIRGMDVLASWALTVPTWCIDSPTTNCIK
jgi:hypothetical protein